MADSTIIDLEELHCQIPNKRPDNFCIAPFQSIRQNPYGRNSPCAFGAGEWHHGHLTPEQRWASRELNQLRQDFINNQRPSECRRCWDEEDAGKQSLRQRQLEYFPKDYNDFILSGKWKHGPKTAVFKVSNVCNLACRSCGGWDSNTFAPEGEYYLNQYNTKMLHDGKLKSWNRFMPVLSPKHMDFSQYHKIAANLEKIDFFGGEPFLNITQLDLLEFLVAQGISKNITLYYSTNCTNKPTPRLQRAWNKFKKIEIAMSIDGIESEFEYLRWPGKWNDVVENIAYIQNLKNQLDCEIYTMASPTFSIMNALVADKLVTWLKENIGPYYATMVTSPSYLAVHIAPDEVKKELLTRIQHPEILGYLTIQEHDPVAWNQFLVWMKRQDLYRKQKFEIVFPEFYKLIEPWWTSIDDLSVDFA